MVFLYYIVFQRLETSWWWAWSQWSWSRFLISSSTKRYTSKDYTRMTMMMVLMTFPDTINTFRIGFFQRNQSSSPGQPLHITRSRQTRGMILWEHSYSFHFLWGRLHFFLLIIRPSSDHCLALLPAHYISQFVDPLPNMWHFFKIVTWI